MTRPLRAKFDAADVAPPHENMHNLVISAIGAIPDRPALVPNTPVTRDIQSEVGPQWVYLTTNSPPPRRGMLHIARVTTNGNPSRSVKA